MAVPAACVSDGRMKPCGGCMQSKWVVWRTLPGGEEVLSSCRCKQTISSSDAKRDFQGKAITVTRKSPPDLQAE